MILIPIPPKIHFSTYDIHYTPWQALCQALFQVNFEGVTPYPPSGLYTNFLALSSVIFNQFLARFLLASKFHANKKILDICLRLC
jgi:hypothetical protein